MDHRTVTPISFRIRCWNAIPRAKEFPSREKLIEGGRQSWFCLPGNNKADAAVCRKRPMRRIFFFVFYSGAACNGSYNKIERSGWSAGPGLRLCSGYRFRRWMKKASPAGFALSTATSRPRFAKDQPSLHSDWATVPLVPARGTRRPRAARRGCFSGRRPNLSRVGFKGAMIGHSPKGKKGGRCWDDPVTASFWGRGRPTSLRIDRSLTFTRCSKVGDVFWARGMITGMANAVGGVITGKHADSAGMARCC